MAGRKPIPYAAYKPLGMKDEAWRQIIEAWRNGLSDREAAFMASEATGVYIKESELKEMVEADPDLERLRDDLGSQLLSRAKMNVADAINANDKTMTRWLLEKKSPNEYASKSAIAFEGAVVELTIEEKQKMVDEFLSNLGGKDGE